MTSSNPTDRSGRRTVCIKLSWPGVAELDRIATQQGTNRSTVVRTLLAEALAARAADAPR